MGNLANIDKPAATHEDRLNELRLQPKNNRIQHDYTLDTNVSHTNNHKPLDLQT